jgi:hypothetical protein
MLVCPGLFASQPSQVQPQLTQLLFSIAVVARLATSSAAWHLSPMLAAAVPVTEHAAVLHAETAYRRCQSSGFCVVLCSGTIFLAATCSNCKAAAPLAAVAAHGVLLHSLCVAFADPM